MNKIRILFAIALIFPCLAIFNESESFVPNIIGMIYTGALFIAIRSKAGRKFICRIYRSALKFNNFIGECKQQKYEFSKQDRYVFHYYFYRIGSKRCKGAYKLKGIEIGAFKKVNTNVFYYKTQKYGKQKFNVIGRAY